MKRFFIFILILIPVLSFAQWKNIGTNMQHIDALAPHDTSVFISEDGLVNRIGVSYWIEADGNIQGSTVSYFASQGRYFFTSTYGHHRLFSTTDDGVHWIQLNAAGPPCANKSYVFGQVFLPTTIIRSSDFGQTWDSVGALDVNNFAATDAYVLAQGSNGNSYGIYRTLDNGLNWSMAPPPPSALSLASFAVIDTNLFAGDTGVFRSTDSGWTWSQHTLTNRIVSAVASYKTYLFAGTDTGVFMSSDLGVTWKNVSDGLLAFHGYYPDVRFLAILDTVLFAGFNVGQNTWAVDYRSIPEMVDSTPSSVVQLPNSDTIMVFPNPSMGTVTVRSGGTSILGITVLNVLGENVQDISALRETAIALDLSKLPSGTYFLQIETPKGTVLRKVVRE